MNHYCSVRFTVTRTKKNRSFLIPQKSTWKAINCWFAASHVFSSALYFSSWSPKSDIFHFLARFFDFFSKPEMKKWTFRSESFSAQRLHVSQVLEITFKKKNSIILAKNWLLRFFVQKQYFEPKFKRGIKLVFDWAAGMRWGSLRSFFFLRTRKNSKMEVFDVCKAEFVEKTTKTKEKQGVISQSSNGTDRT